MLEKGLVFLNTRFCSENPPTLPRTLWTMSNPQETPTVLATDSRKVHQEHSSHWTMIKFPSARGFQKIWKRNLVAEGIEPNPGPSWSQFVQAFEKYIGDDEEGRKYFKQVLPKLKEHVKKFCKVEYVDTIAIQKAIKEDSNCTNLKEAGITESALRAIEEVIQTLKGNIQNTTSSMRI